MQSPETKRHEIAILALTAPKSFVNERLFCKFVCEHLKKKRSSVCSILPLASQPAVSL